MKIRKISHIPSLRASFFFISTLLIIQFIALFYSSSSQSSSPSFFFVTSSSNQKVVSLPNQQQHLQEQRLRLERNQLFSEDDSEIDLDSSPREDSTESTQKQTNNNSFFYNSNVQNKKSTVIPEQQQQQQSRRQKRPENQLYRVISDFRSSLTISSSSSQQPTFRQLFSSSSSQPTPTSICPSFGNSTIVTLYWGSEDVCSICDGSYACSDGQSGNWNHGSAQFVDPLAQDQVVYAIAAKLFYQFDRCTNFTVETSLNGLGKLFLFFFIVNLIFFPQMKRYQRFRLMEVLHVIATPALLLHFFHRLM